jgi:cyanophycinase
VPHTKNSKVSKKRGALIIVGGKEDKEGDCVILREIARRTGKRSKLMVITAASQFPEEVWQTYHDLFADFGLKNIIHLDVSKSEEARDPKTLTRFQGVKSIFFTGGDQLKLTTRIGGTPVFARILKIFEEGGLIAGTSAGAAVMGKTMLVGAEEETESHKIGNWMMAPGLGLLGEIIIDQHFAQRGRIGRLLGAIASNPGILGVGIDEDTSIIVEDDEFRVVGSNAVYVVDGSEVTYTNIAEEAAERTMSMHDVRLHILSNDQVFNVSTRKIVSRGAKA